MILRWLGDDGPLIVLAQARAAAWLGVLRDADDGESADLQDGDRSLVADGDLDPPRTDYARACLALAGPAASVPYAGGTALVFETTGHQAAVVAQPDGAVVAKWVGAPSEAHVAAVLTDLGAVAWADTGVTWDCPPGGALLHKAVAGGSEGDASEPFVLAPGRYAVLHAEIAPDDETMLELFALRAS